jgi:hypothetical protein
VRWIVIRDILLSFCPEAYRRERRPYSPPASLAAAKWLALAQFCASALLLLRNYQHYFVTRAHEWSAQMRGSSEVVQSGTAVIVTLEFLIRPLSLLLLYFAGEGLVRFSAAIVSSEIVPSLPVVLTLKLVQLQQRRREDRRLQSLPPDLVERIDADCLRISSAERKPTWNANITIAIGGAWYELESETRGTAPYLYVYQLRPAPIGKVMRRLEHYGPPDVRDQTSP